MKTIFGKLVLGLLVCALALGSLPLMSAQAAGAADTTTPPATGTKADPDLVKARLERMFARQQFQVESVGRAVENFDLLSKRVQTLLDKAKAKGLNVAAVQSAFDAFKAAFIKGKPVYEQAASQVRSHSGFDGNGKVVDVEKARSTVKSLGETLKQYKDVTGEARKALREALQAFREANPKSGPTPPVEE